MTPILAALPVDTLIWITLLLIGAIGSIASNARKAAKTAPPPTQPKPAAKLEPLREKLEERLAARLQQRIFVEVAPVAPAASPAPVPSPAPAPAPSRVQAPPKVETPPSRAVTHGTRGFRGMFERENLARAVIASEVLGPPKALQEQSIWSPRHSEPSI